MYVYIFIYICATPRAAGQRHRHYISRQSPRRRSGLPSRLQSPNVPTSGTRHGSSCACARGRGGQLPRAAAGAHKRGVSENVAVGRGGCGEAAL